MLYLLDTYLHLLNAWIHTPGTFPIICYHLMNVFLFTFYCSCLCSSLPVNCTKHYGQPTCIPEWNPPLDVLSGVVPTLATLDIKDDFSSLSECMVLSIIIRLVTCICMEFWFWILFKWPLPEVVQKCTLSQIPYQQSFIISDQSELQFSIKNWFPHPDIPRKTVLHSLFFTYVVPIIPVR